MRKTLKELPRNTKARVVDVATGHAISVRLVELGFMAGEWVEVVHEAPLSRDPIVVECSGTRIALRRSEASLILVDDSLECSGVQS